MENGLLPAFIKPMFATDHDDIRLQLEKRNKLYPGKQLSIVGNIPLPIVKDIDCIKDK